MLATTAPRVVFACKVTVDERRSSTAVATSDEI